MWSVFSVELVLHLTKVTLNALKAFEDLSVHPESPRHSHFMGKEDFRTVSSTQALRVTCTHPLAVFPTLTFSLLFLCACLSHTLVWFRGACDPVPLLFQPIWSDYLCLGFLPPPQVPWGAAAGRRLHFISSVCSVLFFSRTLLQVQLSGMEGELSRDQRQWSSSH